MGLLKALTASEVLNSELPNKTIKQLVQDFKDKRILSTKVIEKFLTTVFDGNDIPENLTIHDILEHANVRDVLAKLQDRALPVEIFKAVLGFVREQIGEATSDMAIRVADMLDELLPNLEIAEDLDGIKVQLRMLLLKHLKQLALEQVLNKDLSGSVKKILKRGSKYLGVSMNDKEARKARTAIIKELCKNLGYDHKKVLKMREVNMKMKVKDPKKVDKNAVLRSMAKALHEDVNDLQVESLKFEMKIKYSFPDGEDVPEKKMKRVIAKKARVTEDRVTLITQSGLTRRLVGGEVEAIITYPEEEPPTEESMKEMADTNDLVTELAAEGVEMKGEVQASEPEVGMEVKTSKISEDTLDEQVFSDEIEAALVEEGIEVEVQEVEQPTDAPTASPTFSPTDSPTQLPTVMSTPRPTKPGATNEPTEPPTSEPTSKPSAKPTNKPTTAQPTEQPTWQPTSKSTLTPTSRPTRPGETHEPTARPTSQPTSMPTLMPTPRPTRPGETNEPEGTGANETLENITDQHLQPISATNGRYGLWVLPLVVALLCAN